MIPRFTVPKPQATPETASGFHWDSSRYSPRSKNHGVRLFIEDPLCMPQSKMRKVSFADGFSRAAFPYFVLLRSHSSYRIHLVAWDHIEPLSARRKKLFEKIAQKAFCRPFGHPCTARTYTVRNLRRLRYNE